MRNIILFIALLSFVFGSFAFEYQYKSPQGDPSEFNIFETPTPEDTVQHSYAAFLEINLQKINGKLLWKGEVACDSDTKLSLSFLSPIYKHLKIEIKQPGRNQLSPISELVQELPGTFGIDGASYESHTFEFTNPTKGIWQVLITSDAEKELEELKSIQKRSDLASGMLIVGNESPFQSAAHISSLSTISGDEVGYELRLVDVSKLSEEDKVGQPIVVPNLHAELEIIEPDGEEIVIKMQDDGLHGDRKANDGIFYGSLKVIQDGLYQASMTLYGDDPNGLPFFRSIETVFQVVKDTIDLIGNAYAIYDSDHKVFDIFVGVKENPSKSAQVSAKDLIGKTYKIWGEVWGKNSDGKYVPVAWVSGIKELSKDKNGNIVIGPIELNERWIDRVSVKTGLKLRNLRISDLDWSVIIDTIPSIKIEMEEKFQNELPTIPLSQGDEPLDIITIDMKEGWRTKEYIEKNRARVNSSLSCTLALVHGYCAGSNPFPMGDFTSAQAFTGGFGQSLSNDQFSKKLITFIQNHPCTVAVAHSQGGMAITHTHNYYITPFDSTPTNKRLLQTVGTPFQGTALAGSIAGLGEIFGAGCGSNNDLTYSGSKSWISGISNRNKVFYYFTQYGKGVLWNACNTASNLVLSWPNDGTTENAYAPLPNANNQPSNPTVGECHTTGMNFPPQCSSSSRNRQINSYAHQ